MDQGQNSGDDKCLLGGSDEVSSNKDGQSSSQLTTTSNKYTTTQKWTLFIIIIGDFAVTLGYSILSAFFPEEAKSKGAGPLSIGVIFAIFEFVIFITSPIFGAYITTLGSRFLFFSGLFMGGVTCILFGFLNECPPGIPFITLCLALRCVSGLGTSAYLTSAFAIVTKTFPDQAATMMGSIEMVNGLAFMVGPALGGGLYNLGGWILPFVLLGSFELVVMVISAKYLPVVDESVTEHRGKIWKVLTIPAVVVTCVSLFVSASSLSFLDPLLQPLIERDENGTASPLIVGLIFLCGSGVYTLLSPAWGWAADKWPKHCLLMMMFGAVIMAAAFFFMGPSPLLGIDKSQIWMVCVALVLFGLGAGGQVMPPFKFCLMQLVHNGYPDNFETYGLVSGLFNSFFSLGAAVGPFIQGAVTQDASMGWACTVASGANVLLFFIILPYYVTRQCRQSPSGALSVQSGDVTPSPGVTPAAQVTHTQNDANLLVA